MASGMPYMPPPPVDLDGEEYSSESEDEQNENVDTKATPETSSTPLDPSQVGMSLGEKKLYSGKEDKRGRFQWQTEMPKDVGTPAQDAESEKWALIVRYVRVYNDPTKVITIHSILVQSPLIKELLEDVLDGYPGVTASLKTLEFSGRFEPLIHRWPVLRQAIKDLEKQKADGTDDLQINDRIDHAKLLDELLVKEFTEIEVAMKDMKENGVMSYDNLWTVFEPNVLIYGKQDNQDRAFRLQSSKYGVDRNNAPCFWLTGVYIDYDGTRFGTQKLNIQIPEFEGTMPINGLSGYPMEFHSQAGEMKAKLIERGSRVEAISSGSNKYCSYSGIGWRMNPYGGKDKYSVKGRVVIDTFGFNRFMPDHAVYVTPLNNPSGPAFTNNGVIKKRRGGRGGLNSTYSYSADPNLFLDIDDGGMPVDGFFEDESDASKRPPLAEDQQLICTPLIRGYALKEKQWLNLFINAVSDISFNERAFESLNLPNNQKDLILGFTSTKQSYRNQFDDVIEGKGRGIIILLSGPPGVGKTLTAESVSEQLKAPLYTLAAGDLGHDPRSVETKLQGVLDMCSRWNAICLIDEADVFLEQRSMHDLERNKLVSIFLRVLEYYEGIMFLTTNRVSTFDRAFESRIHLSLEYSELDKKSRKAIWEVFLKPLDHQMAAKDINKLSDLKLNGRQIKNFLKTAAMLANHKGEKLAYGHVEQVTESMAHLHKANQASDEARSGVYS